jgi:YVTN family beta-propeller protein
MLHLAITTLLAMQTASGAPYVAPGTPPAATGEAPPETSPATTPSATPRSRTTPRRTPTPGPKASNDVLLVVNKSDNSISILDGSTGKLRFTASGVKGPHEVEVLADGKMAAVSDYGKSGDPGRLVLLIDLATGKVVSRVDIGAGSRPHGLKALRDGRLLVTAEGTRELVVVDPLAAKVLQRIPTGSEVSHMVAASPDGRRAYVPSLGNGSVTVIDLKPGKVVSQISTGKGAEGIDVTPDGREIWVANRDANTISIIDAGLQKVVFTIRAPEFPIRVKITPDGRRAVVSYTGSGDVGVYDVATRAEAKRIPIGRDAVEGTPSRVFQKRFGSSPAPVGIFIAPDGSRAWVSASHADVVAVIDLANLRVDDAWTAGREPDGLSGRFQKK